MAKLLTAGVVVLLALYATGCSKVTITVERADAGAAQAAASPTPAVAFATPEDAISYYLDGVAQNDTGKILEACAIAEMSEQYQAELFVERLGGVMMLQMMPAPADYPFYRDVNKAQQTARILAQVRNFAYALLSDEDVAAATPIMEVDSDRVRKFITDVDPAQLATIEVTNITPPPVPAASETRYSENSERIARIYGADEYTERVVSFTYEGSDYYTGFQLLRYGDNWKVMDQSSPMGNTSALGVPVKQ